METSSLETRYRNHTILYDDIKQTIGQAQLKILYPLSNQMLLDLSNRTTLIFEGIINMAKNGNLYSAFILYRSLLEHFFKGKYILNKMVMDKNDIVAESYQKHYFISEFLAENAGILEMEDIINDNTVKTDFIKFLVSKRPHLEGFDKANQQEISAAVKQFSLKEIIKYLHSEYKKKDSLAEVKDVVAHMIPEYSYVSTFTHGGSYASVLMEKFKTQNEIENQLTRILEISFTATCDTKECVFMSYEMGAYFKDYILALHKTREI